MASREWTVTVRRGDTDEVVKTYIVIAPTWLSAELIAEQAALEEFGPGEYDIDGEALFRFSPHAIKQESED